jgi:hypothetical protein
MHSATERGKFYKSNPKLLCNACNLTRRASLLQHLLIVEELGEEKPVFCELQTFFGLLKYNFVKWYSTQTSTHVICYVPLCEGPSCSLLDKRVRVLNKLYLCSELPILLFVYYEMWFHCLFLCGHQFSRKAYTKFSVCEFTFSYSTFESGLSSMCCVTRTEYRLIIMSFLNPKCDSAINIVPKKKIPMKKSMTKYFPLSRHCHSYICGTLVGTAK